MRFDEGADLNTSSIDDLRGSGGGGVGGRVALGGGGLGARGEGDLDAALELLDQADRVYVGDFLPNVRPVRRGVASRGGGVSGRGPWRPGRGR